MPATASDSDYHLHVDGGLYRLVGHGKSSEGAAPVAIYEHLHPFERGLWSRPLHEFERRFARVDALAAASALAEPAEILQGKVAAAKAARREREAAAEPASAPAPLLHCLGFMFAPGFERVALIHKLTPEWQRGMLNGIGGKAEPGESAIQAMTREFHEEAGVPTSESDWRFFARIGAPEFEVHAFWCASDRIDSCASLTAERVEVMDIRDERVLSLGITGLPALMHSALDPDEPFCRFDYREWARAARAQAASARP